MRADLVEFPTFFERAPWLGGHLQTLRNTLWRRQMDLTPWSEKRVEVAFEDGDRTIVVVHAPERAAANPVLFLFHGLTGCADSAYMRASARFFLQVGCCAARVNLRGALPVKGSCQGHYNAGRSEDLAKIVEGTLERLTEGGVKVVWALGFSLGGNMLLKLLGERWSSSSLIEAAASVSAPIDLKAAQVRIMQPSNWFYHRYILNRMKAETPGVSSAMRRRIRTLWQFDEEIVAPMAGYRGAEDYYAGAAAKSYMAAIATPTLLIHADNDPWISREIYEHGDWRHNPALTLAVTRGGGHVGFHGTGSAAPWYNRAAFEFFRSEG